MFASFGLRRTILRRAFAFYFNVDHEWINFDETTMIGTVGITEYAHEVLGDVNWVQMPSVGTKFKQGDVMGHLESSRVTDDIYCPLSGTVIEVNKTILHFTGLINSDPESQGWLLKLKLEDLDELKELYDRKDYMKLVAQLKGKDHHHK